MLPWRWSFDFLFGDRMDKFPDLFDDVGPVCVRMLENAQVVGPYGKNQQFFLIVPSQHKIAQPRKSHHGSDFIRTQAAEHDHGGNGFRIIHIMGDHMAVVSDQDIALYAFNIGYAF